MVILVLILLLVMPQTVFAHILRNLEADQIDYDTKKIRLAGKVYIVHQFGEIRCDKGVLLFEDEHSTKLSPSRILLNGTVKIVLQDGSIITSDEADIDCKTLEGVFVATAPQKVSYVTRVVEQNKSHPVKVASKALRVLMKKVDGDKSEYVLADVQGEGAVSIEYHKLSSEE